MQNEPDASKGRRSIHSVFYLERARDRERERERRKMLAQALAKWNYLSWH